MTPALFIYGSMRDEDVRAAVTGVPVGTLRCEPAWIHGAVLARVPGESYPYLVARRGARAGGELVYGLDEQAQERIQFFEGDEYAFSACVVERADGTVVDAMHFGIVAAGDCVAEPWSFDAWQVSEKDRFLAMTRQYMALWRRADRRQAEAEWQRLLREYGVDCQ